MKDFGQVFLVLVFGAVLFWIGYANGSAKYKHAITLDSVALKVDSSVYQASIDIPATPERNDSLIIVKEPYPVPADVDSQAVFQAMFERRQYQVRHQDTNIVINFRPTIAENRLIGVDLDYQWLRPVSISHYSAKPTKGIYLGGQIGSMFAGPSIDWQFNSRWMLGASYSVINTSSPLQIRVQYKIWEYR